MKVLSEIAVYTKDPERLEKFYKRYFYAGREDGREDPETGARSFFLRFDGDARLRVVAPPGLRDRPQGGPQVGLAGLAFSAGGERGVDSLTAEIVKGGQTMLEPPHRTESGGYESCIADPDGNRIRITA